MSLIWTERRHLNLITHTHFCIGGSNSHALIRGLGIKVEGEHYWAKCPVDYIDLDSI